MSSTRLLSALLASTLAASAFASASAQNTPKGVVVIHADATPNTPAQQAKHYVVLVSLDGFRFDYVDHYATPSLKALAAAGATAPTGMIPSFPSITFPNHLSLITGLFPEHHGIVGNSFYDPARNETYNYHDKSVTDGTWYTGTPLWSLAEAQGMRAASFFWPGSEAKIGGYRPDDYLAFDNTVDDDKRIDQVAAWLAEPAADRPHLITLYYSNVDHEGHEHGPNSPEVEGAVHHVDQLMGKLRKRLDATGLPVDLVVVADHGMAATQGNWIDLATFADLSHFKTQGAYLYPDSEADAARAFAGFKTHADPRFTAYRRADVPAYLHFNENAREGDPILIPNGPYLLRARDTSNGHGHAPAGEHGYDPYRMPSMKALFIANGPDIMPGTKLASFPNVDVYDFIAALLGLTPGPTDGDLAPLAPALRKQ